MGRDVTENSAWKIWAPNAKAVELVVNGRTRAAERIGGGYWSSPLPPTDADYQVRIDGRLRPDPRSPCQPEGVHGPSRRPGHDFAWNDKHARPAPLTAAIVYELHIGTFTKQGTFTAAIEHLPHLRRLGVTHIELMPIAAFPGRHGWGYDGTALFAPHPAYGSPDQLKRFVFSAHELGLGVILDVVYNHLGPDGNYLAEFGPYFTEQHRTAWGAALNFDAAESHEVRRFFIDNACMWLRDYHFDGLRLDAVHAIHDESARHFLEELAEEVATLSATLRRPLVLIAESDLNDPRLVRAREAGGFGLDAQWSDDFHHALHAALTGERAGYYADFGELAQIARALTDGYVYSGQYSESRKRRHGRPLGEVSGHRLLAYLQNHDQIGNRAQGERIGHLISPGLLRIGAALVFVSPYIPMLFQGEEWNASAPFQYFTDHPNQEVGDAVGEGRRREFAAFGWQSTGVPDPQDEQTFRRSVLDWSELERPPHNAVLDWYRALARLRAQTPDLLDGRRDRVHVQVDEQRRVILVQRGGITLQANLGLQRVELARPAGEPILAFPEAPVVEREQVAMGPETCAIWRR
jgi:maltooligosyltrehalose trehalohydrolase